jgi:hypothetical protein
MNPDSFEPQDNANPKIPVESIYPPAPVVAPIVTGSQLDAMRQQDDHLRMQKKLKLVLVASSVLVVFAVGFSIYSFIIASSGDSPEEPSTSNTANQSSQEQDDSPPSAPVEKYKDTGLSMEGNAYRLKYFKDGEYAAACEPNVTKPCEGLYTEDMGRPKAYLKVGPVNSKDAARICTGQEKPSFTFTGSDGAPKQACETGFDGNILYYNALLSLNGKNYQVIFMGETRKGVAYPNVSVYKQDLQAIFPTITLAL